MSYKQLQECVKRHFANNSRSRESLYKLLSETDDACLSAEDIRERIQKIYPRDVSLNTIYRHLDFLMECQLVLALQAGSTRVFCLRKEGIEFFAVCPHCGTAVRFSPSGRGIAALIPDADYVVVYRKCEHCL